MGKLEILKRLEELRKNEAKKYTAKDRLLFEKFDILKEKKGQFEQRYEEIEKIYSSTMEVIGKRPISPAIKLKIYIYFKRALIKKAKKQSQQFFQISAKHSTSVFRKLCPVA